MHSVAITGVGLVTAAGRDIGTFWANISAGKSCISPIVRFDASRYRSRFAGQIEDVDQTSHVPERLRKKLDAFSHFALLASHSALRDGDIRLERENPKQSGIFFGNALGGWLFAETELRDLYVEGRTGVSPYMASAWFPAAPQGQVSIFYGIKGLSKTIVADRASSLMALAYAGRTLQNGQLELALAGGTEAPVTPYALLCCSTYGWLSERSDRAKEAYRPFDRARNGCVLGEGAAVVVMERLARARARKARVRALVAGYGTSCDGADRRLPAQDGRQLARAIRRALEQAEAHPESIDFICLDGLGTPEADDSEVAGLQQVFGERLERIPVSCPKAVFGNLLGASGAVDVITTILAMEHGAVPPTPNLTEPAIAGLDYVTEGPRFHRVDQALVISRGRGGINTALVLRRP